MPFQQYYYRENENPDEYLVIKKTELTALYNERYILTVALGAALALLTFIMLFVSFNEKAQKYIYYKKTGYYWEEVPDDQRD